jgi:hypothetical protein
MRAAVRNFVPRFWTATPTIAGQPNFPRVLPEVSIPGTSVSRAHGDVISLALCGLISIPLTLSAYKLLNYVISTTIRSWFVFLYNLHETEGTLLSVTKILSEGITVPTV